MPSVAAAASISATGQRRVAGGIQTGFITELFEEKKKLEQELTSRFPADEDIIFDKDLFLLMMDGYCQEIQLRCTRCKTQIST